MMGGGEVRGGRGGMMMGERRPFSLNGSIILPNPLHHSSYLGACMKRQHAENSW